MLDRDRGALDRVADAVEEPEGDGDLYRLAGQDCSGRRRSRLLEQAEASARTTVEELLAEAGVGDVAVVFNGRAAADAA